MLKSSVSKTRPPGNGPSGLLSPQQALVVAARACNHLLLGTPPRASFNPAHLNQTLILLTQMAATITPVSEPAGGEPAEEEQR